MTEKLDGSSVTFVNKNEELYACSCNLGLLETEGNSIWKSARALKAEEKLRLLNEERYAIQEEIVGQGIQKNPLKIAAFLMSQMGMLDQEEFGLFRISRALPL